ncbi:MAG TPA: YciI family protein [Chitinophaga sp.]
MKDYVLLFRVGPRFLQASPEELQQILLQSKEWIGSIAQGGKLNGVVRLQRSGAVLRGKKQQLTDGPLTEDEKMVNGIVTVKAGSLEEAIAIAKGNPIFEYEGVMEIREVASNN